MSGSGNKVLVEIHYWLNANNKKVSVLCFKLCVQRMLNTRKKLLDVAFLVFVSFSRVIGDWIAHQTNTVDNCCIVYLNLSLGPPVGLKAGKAGG